MYQHTLFLVRIIALATFTNTKFGNSFFFIENERTRT